MGAEILIFLCGIFGGVGRHETARGIMRNHEASCLIVMNRDES